MFDIQGTIPHQKLYHLIPEFGPVLRLKLGSVNTLVIQSANAAAELFKNHDQVFCDRKCGDVFSALDYNKGSLIMGRYGPYWRMLRRLCMSELMSAKNINQTVHIRRKCVQEMALNLEKEEGEVNLSYVLFIMTFNLIGNLVLSRDLADKGSKEGREFQEAMQKFIEWAAMPNVSDFLPSLKWLDLQGIKKNMERDMGRVMEIIGRFVKDRIEEKKTVKEKEAKDFLDVVLEHQAGTEELTDHNVVIFILELFIAGSETSSNTMEWAMAELLRSPDTRRKAKEELDRVVGPSREVEESDMEQLPYLQAVIKETLRLHPPGPFLIPRNSMADSNFMGYFIPKDTQVLVNAWAIGRDPDAWVDPLVFKPERFLGSKIDYKGQNFEFIPFGSGRRICAGMLLAHRFLHLGLATLLHRFNWVLPTNTTPESLDMSEKNGIAVRKLVPLKAIPKMHF